MQCKTTVQGVGEVKISSDEQYGVGGTVGRSQIDVAKAGSGPTPATLQVSVTYTVPYDGAGSNHRNGIKDVELQRLIIWRAYFQCQNCRDTPRRPDDELFATILVGNCGSHARA